jgi:hypothetical protein
LKRIQAGIATPLAFAILALNAYLCRELFRVEYLRHMGSVEGSFIGLARYTKDHWRDLSWFPSWHLGLPYANAYPPLLGWETAAFSAISGFSIAHAFHFVAALTYCLGPVALFALALRLTKSPWTAFTAAAMYSFVSWSAWLIPGIAADLGSVWHPRRLQALVLYGETPHIASMTLLPVALLFWDLALERRRAVYVLLAAVSAAAVVLTSWIGGFALAMMIVALAFTRVPDRRDLGMMAMVAAAAYCLAMPWAAPSVIAATQFNSKTLGGDFRETYRVMPVWFVAALLCLVLLKIAMRRLAPQLQFSIFTAFLFASIVFPWTWFQVAVVVQPVRYHLELEMALSLLVACGAQRLLKNRPRPAAIAMTMLCVALILPVRSARRYARELIRPIDITTTTEWKMAQWLNREWTGQRVMMPGSVAYWLLAFSDVPQLNGGPQQGVVAYASRVAEFDIYYGPPYATGRNGEFSVLWLKALGVQAVDVSGPGSGEAYKPFIDRHQFDGLLQPIYQSGGDTVYRVGLPSASLARIVPRAALVTRMPENGIDVDPLRPYVTALDDPTMPRASFQWTSQHSAHIAADLQPSQALSVQIAWTKGWHSNVPVKRDAIGLIYLDAPRGGHMEVDLDYDGGTEMKIARVMCVGCALLLAGACLARLLPLKNPGR